MGRSEVCSVCLKNEKFSLFGKKFQVSVCRWEKWGKSDTGARRCEDSNRNLPIGYRGNYGALKAGEI